MWRRTRRFVIHNVLHADDPPHRLALGVAVGLFVMFTPTVGIQMVSVFLLCWALGANKAIGLIAVWLSNPVTIVPMYWACYEVGVALTGGNGVDKAWWKTLAHPPDGWLTGVQFYWDRFTEVAAPMWVGCLLVGAVVAVGAYALTYKLICAYRMRRWGQLVPPTAALPNGPRAKPAPARGPNPAA